MIPRPDPSRRTSAVRGAVSRDAGLLRIRAATKGAAVAAAFGSVALGLVLAHPSQSQAASPPAEATSGQGTGGSNTQAASSASSQQLAPPPQPPADVAPQAQPQAVSGGS